MPVARRNQIVRTDQPQASVRERLVDDDLRTRRVEHAVVENQRQVHVVETHRTVLAAVHAAEHELITCLLGLVHVAEALRDFTHDLDQRTRLGAAVQRGVRLGVNRPRLWERETQDSETQAPAARTNRLIFMRTSSIGAIQRLKRTVGGVL